MDDCKGFLFLYLKLLLWNTEFHHFHGKENEILSFYSELYVHHYPVKVIYATVNSNSMLASKKQHLYSPQIYDCECTMSQVPFVTIENCILITNYLGMLCVLMKIYHQLNIDNMFNYHQKREKHIFLLYFFLCKIIIILNEMFDVHYKILLINNFSSV